MLPISLQTKSLAIRDRWSLHSYYTLCPYAPDNSGRILVAGADLSNGKAEIFILSKEGAILDSFGEQLVTPSFWHTAFWQSWSPDAQYVYYQSGDHLEPQVVRRNLATKEEICISGDMEGIPPSGEPGLSCSHGLLYAAGYGDDVYKPEKALTPFQERDKHGISIVDFDPIRAGLILSTAEILERHPDRDKLRVEDKKIKERLGQNEGLTLMTYCLRWNPQGTRCLFYFGNHCVDKRRNEPKLAYIFTADKNLKNIELALDISFERKGVHWGWQPDGERLIGYGPKPDEPGKISLAEINYDGSGYLALSDHSSGGHPSVSPTDDNLIVTDEKTQDGGAVVFISRSNGQEKARSTLPKFIGNHEPSGRNPERICHHPVFSHDGSRVLCNVLPGRHAELIEITPPT